MDFKTIIKWGDHNWVADLQLHHDISIPLKNGAENPIAWYCNPPVIQAVENEFFIGDVSRGGNVNFRDIMFNPHGHGTHTECVGHISQDLYSVNDSLTSFFFRAVLVSILPEKKETGDLVIGLNALINAIGDIKSFDAIVIRTLPNQESKKIKNYSNTNPPYFEHSIGKWLCDNGVKHWLTDLPSVDREQDGGMLAAHHAFWNYPENPRVEATITEFVYIENTIKDGLYLLNLQTAPFHNDASPSRPLLFPLKRC